MSVHSYIQAMPKVELNVHLEGAIQRETLLLIAEQNDILSTMKNLRQFNEWIALYDRPDYARIDEIARTFASWLLHPEDITRVVYDLGVHLHRQNVRYAEVSVQPAIYTDSGMTFETFLDALNDGRDRVERAWGVKMNWVLMIPRDRPRKGDDISRWAIGSAARKGNVVGMGICGREDLQPSAQFKKAFNSVQKKDVGTVTNARSWQNAEDLGLILETLTPDRLTDSWSLNEEERALIAARELPLVITPTRELRLNRIKATSDYPLQALYDDGVRLVVSAGMPELYKTTLTDELVAITAVSSLSLDEVERINANAIQSSFLDEAEKRALLESFEASCKELRLQHLETSAE